MMLQAKTDTFGASLNSGFDVVQNGLQIVLQQNHSNKILLLEGVTCTCTIENDVTTTFNLEPLLLLIVNQASAPEFDEQANYLCRKATNKSCMDSLME